MAARLQMIGAAFNACRHATEGDDMDHIERLEQLILKHKPLGAEDAAIVLFTALGNLRNGGRPDELDVHAVERVIEWIERQSIPALQAAG